LGATEEISDEGRRS